MSSLSSELPAVWPVSRDRASALNYPSVEMKEASLFPPLFPSFLIFRSFATCTIFFFSSAWYGSIVVVLLLLSAHVHLYLSLPGQKQKAVNKSKLGLFLFVLSNAQFLLEVALSGCVPSCLFSSSSAPCGCTRECVCCVCKCAHVSQVCNM